MATLTTLRQALDAAQLRSHELILDSGMILLITQRGARVLGLFPDAQAENLLWTTESLNDPTDFAAFIARNDWNLGGERFWVAPEVSFHVGDRDDFWATLAVPPQTDPGDWTMTLTGDRVMFEQSLTLTARGMGTGESQLHLARTLTRSANPILRLREAGKHMQDVVFAGYAQTATISDSSRDNVPAEMWNLVQLVSGGTLILPCTPEIEATDYFGKPTSDCFVVEQGAVRIALTGKQQFKLGYKALCMTSRLGYHTVLADGRHALLVRHFPNDPSNLYAEEPAGLPGVNGHSVHVYNDGGEFGGTLGFGEMECTGTTIGGATGRTTATDTFHLWIYIGAPDAIARLVPILLGVAL